MPREHVDYRNNIELLNLRYPNYDMLSIEDVMQVTGYTSRNTIKKYLGKSFVNGRISKAAVARYMCGKQL